MAITCEKSGSFKDNRNERKLFLTNKKRQLKYLVYVMKKGCMDKIILLRRIESDKIDE